MSRTSSSFLVARRGAVALLLLVALLCSCFVTPATAAVKRGGKSSASSGGLSSSLARAASSSKKGYVELPDTATFDSLVAPPRNYSAAVLLTAVNSGVNCAPCQLFQPVFETLGRSWASKASKTQKSDFVLGTMEFKDGREIFQRLQLTYAPVLLFFPPTTGFNAKASGDPIKYDFNRLGFEAQDVADFLNEQLPYAFPYSAPFPWVAIGAFLGGFTAFAALVYFVAPKLADSNTSINQLSAQGLKTAIMLGSLATITIMCSGHMWNSIRQAPYMSVGQGGRPEYFAQGFQNQYGAETHIVAAFYSLLAFSFVSLTVFVPAQRDPVRQRAGVYVWSVIFLATFSLVFAVFRIKNPSYPFRLFF